MPIRFPLVREGCLARALHGDSLVSGLALKGTRDQAGPIDSESANGGSFEMPTYISLITLSHQGITNIKESPSRLEAAREVMRSFGGELKDFYFTMGQHDIVVISEAPDDVAVAKGLLAIASTGNVRSETMRAFREDEYREIVGSVPAAENQAFAALDAVRQKLIESVEELQRVFRHE